MIRSLLFGAMTPLLFLSFSLTPNVSEGQDTVSLMNYNILNYPGSTPERHEYMRKVVHYSQPDLVLANEVIDAGGVATLLDSSFNRFGVTKYDTARFIDGTDTDNMLFYNSDLFGLASQDTIQTQLRKIDHYKVFYRDTGLGSTHNDTSFLHLFALHLKASTSSSDQQQRAEEASQLMGYLDQLPDSAEVIAAGDYNIYYPTSEEAWDTLTDPAYTNRLHDPLKTNGDWHNDPQYAPIHTQSTRDNGCTGTAFGAGGGMDDRFDLNLVDADVLDGTGRFELDSSSYRALGQDGQHLDTCIIAQPPTNNTVPDSVLNALYNMSDHLPVLMDLHFDCEAGKVIASDSTSICQGDTAWVGGNPYTTEGWAYDTIYSELSCNKFEATYVDLQAVDTNVTSIDDTLYAQASNASYQWFDCSDGSPIGGATDSSFVPSSSGNYGVEVTQDTCSDRSGCHSVLLSDLSDRSDDQPQAKLYPDPGREFLHIEFSRPVSGSVRVLDLQGRPLMKEELSPGSSDLRLNTSALSEGLYLIEYRDPQKGVQQVHKWTKAP